MYNWHFVLLSNFLIYKLYVCFPASTLLIISCSGSTLISQLESTIQSFLFSFIKYTVSGSLALLQFRALSCQVASRGGKAEGEAAEEATGIHPTAVASQDGSLKFDVKPRSLQRQIQIPIP